MPNNLPGKKPRVAIVVTSVLIVKFFLVPHLTALSKIYDVTLILKNDEPGILNSLDLPVRIITVPIERKISLWQDLRALAGLFAIFRREKFDLVHSLSPKGGLLGMVSAWASSVPVRIHTFQGEIWVNKKGLWRQLLRFLDKLVGRLATRVTVVSESERQFLIAHGIVSEKKSCVLANGSIGGVDLERFHPDEGARKHARESLGLAEGDVLFMYVGRLNEDKGLLELGQAFRQLAMERTDVHLLIVGPDEENIQQKLSSRINDLGQRLTFLPYTPKPESIMAAADILVLPSHREGFGVVIIEAAALGIPAIGSDIYGITDAIQDKSTGLLFSKGEVIDLYEKMKLLTSQPGLRIEMGMNARLRAEKEFVQAVVVRAFLDFYGLLLGNRPGGV